MVSSGVPVRNGSRHIIEGANVALDLLSASTTFRVKHRPKIRLQLRIGKLIIILINLFMINIDFIKSLRKL